MLELLHITLCLAAVVVLTLGGFALSAFLAGFVERYMTRRESNAAQGVGKVTFEDETDTNIATNNQNAP